MGFLFPRTHGMVKNSLRSAEASAKPQTIDVMVQKAHLGTGPREIKAPAHIKEFFGKEAKKASLSRNLTSAAPPKPTRASLENPAARGANQGAIAPSRRSAPKKSSRFAGANNPPDVRRSHSPVRRHRKKTAFADDSDRPDTLRRKPTGFLSGA